MKEGKHSFRSVFNSVDLKKNHKKKKTKQSATRHQDISNFHLCSQITLVSWSTSSDKTMSFSWIQNTHRSYQVYYTLSLFSPQFFIYYKNWCDNKKAVSPHMNEYVKLSSNLLAYKNTSNLIPKFKISSIMTDLHTRVHFHSNSALHWPMAAEITENIIRNPQRIWVLSEFTLCWLVVLQHI